MKRYTFLLAIVSICLVAAVMVSFGATPIEATLAAALFSANTVPPGAITVEQLAAITKGVEDLSVKVKTDLEDANKRVKEFGDELVKKTSASEKVSGELKESVDKALAEQAELRKSVDGFSGTLTELTQELAKRKSSPDVPEDEKTAGQIFIDDESFKKAAATPGFRGRIRVDMKMITTATGGAANLVVAQRIPGIVALPERRMTVRDLLTPGRTSSNAIQYVRETGFTNGAAVQANEGDTKGESGITFELITRSVATIAHFIIASKQILDDAPMLQSTIDGRLRYGLAYKEEDQLLNGNGTGANLHGIIPQASDYSPAFAVAAQQRIDILRLALLQSELAEFPANGLVLHPTDWAKVELTKDGENRYIFANPQTETQPRIWGRPVVGTQAMDLGEFLAGAFRLGAQVFDREDAAVEISTEDSDNFRKNLVTVRAEERLVLAVYRPEAFVHGEFGDAS